MPKYRVGSTQRTEAKSVDPQFGMVTPQRLVAKRVWLRKEAAKRSTFL
jgi:hypothetical protein